MTAPDVMIPAETFEKVFKRLYPYMDTGGSEQMAREVCYDACLDLLRGWPGMKEESRDGWNWEITGGVNTFRFTVLILPFKRPESDG